MKLVVPPPFVAFVAAAGMWGLDQSLPVFQIEFGVQRETAILVAGLGFLIDMRSMFGFFAAKTTIDPVRPDATSSLVTDGLYRFSRNPMYIGLALMLTGWMIWLGQPVNLLLLAVFIWFVTEFQIKPEEAVLREKFGEAYEAYCARVRRWV